MEFRVAYELNQELFRESVRLFFRTVIDVKVKALALAYFVLVTILNLISPGFAAGVFAGAGLVLALLVALGYSIRVRPGDDFLRKLTDRKAECTINEEGIHLVNAIGTSRLAWNMLEKLVMGERVWNIHLSRQHFFVVPAEGLRGDAESFAERKAKENRVKVFRR